MPVIVQGRKQYIVSTETLLAWKRFEWEHPDAEIIAQDENDALTVRIDDGGQWRIARKRIEEIN